MQPAGRQGEGCRYTIEYSSRWSGYGTSLDPDYSSAPLICPVGGWVMTATGLSRFVRALRHTDKIISRDSYDNMTRLIKADGRSNKVPYLAFDGFKEDDYENLYDGGTALEKGGDIEDYGSLVVMLPEGYTLVALSNSLGSGRLKRTARKAWNDAHPAADGPGGIGW